MFLRTILGIFLLSNGINLLAVKEKAVLTKAVLHTAHDNPWSIERGSLIFYFTTEPVITVKKTTMPNNGERLEVIFSPVTFVQSPELLRIIGQLNDTKTEGYTVRVVPGKKADKSLLLTINYDPAQTTVSYDTIDTINVQKGVVFHFHNRVLVQRLESTQKPTIITAWHCPPVSVVIDCGHGGADNGAIGISGIKEKDVCLQLAHKVAALLRDRGVQTFLTRSDDSDCSFAQRTYAANGQGVDACVSIHANHAPNKNAHGIETFYCDYSLKTTKFSTLTPVELPLLVSWHNDRTSASKKLAASVHSLLVNAVTQMRSDVLDRSVKKAASQLLLGCQVPAILVEVGFLSNEHEEKLLASDDYQTVIAGGIADGVIAYCSY